MHFVASVLTIVGSAAALGSLTWTLITTNDGRIKALLLWSIGITVLGAYVLYRLTRRESVEARYGRALEAIHGAHHLLRDAAYQRYIARAPDVDVKITVEAALKEFCTSFTIATGSSCHATIKVLADANGDAGRSVVGDVSSLTIDTYCRSGDRSPRMRTGIPANTVGRNTDFRVLMNPDENNRCWHHNDLLSMESYENPHWPSSPTVRNVPYRATMVWPIRKVLREAGATNPSDSYVYGFLTVDTPEPNVFVYERHFHLGAGFADHLLSVLWDPQQTRFVHEALMGIGAR